MWVLLAQRPGSQRIAPPTHGCPWIVVSVVCSGTATDSGEARNARSGLAARRAKVVGSVASGHPANEETVPSTRSPCGVETSNGAPESPRQVPVPGAMPAAQNVSAVVIWRPQEAVQAA